MSKTSYQHDFSFSYGEEVSPKLARKVMRDVYKMVEYQKALEDVRKILKEHGPSAIFQINLILNEALK